MLKKKEKKSAEQCRSKRHCSPFSFPWTCSRGRQFFFFPRWTRHATCLPKPPPHTLSWWKVEGAAPCQSHPLANRPALRRSPCSHNEAPLPLPPINGDWMPACERREKKGGTEERGQNEEREREITKEKREGRREKEKGKWIEERRTGTERNHQ